MPRPMRPTRPTTQQRQKLQTFKSASLSFMKEMLTQFFLQRSIALIRGLTV
jgi:hypothetical protein